VQNHTDQETPVFIGPDVNDVQFTQSQPLTPFDFAVLFTGPNITYREIGTLPSGLNLSANGILTGTPDTPEVQQIQVEATNPFGSDVTNTFTMTIIELPYTLDVQLLSGPSCTYLYPDTECTATGQYIAVPTNYVPDTWLWELTTAPPGVSITAGQGTDTVTVQSTQASNVNFTLKCTASNSTPQSAQDLTQFSSLHTDNSTPITNIQITEDQAGSCTYEDTDIIWGGNEFTTTDNGTSVADALLYFYENSNGIPGIIPPPFDSTCGYYNPDDVIQLERVIAEASTPFSTGVYIVKFDIVQIVSGDGAINLNYTPGREGQYWDLFRCDIRLSANVGTPSQETVADITIAEQLGGDENAGTATPVPGTERTRRVRFIAQVP
jgi:hypothetical protein